MARPHGRRPSEKHPARSWPAPARRCGGCRLSAGGAGARQTCPVQQTAVRQRVVAHGAAALHSKECLQPERPMTATDPPAAAAWRPGPPHHGRRGHGHRPGLRADAKAGPHPTAAAARQPGQLWRLRRPRPEGRLPDAQRRTRPRVRPRPSQPQRRRRHPHRPPPSPLPRRPTPHVRAAVARPRRYCRYRRYPPRRPPTPTPRPRPHGPAAVRTAAVAGVMSPTPPLPAGGPAK